MTKLGFQSAYPRQSLSLWVRNYWTAFSDTGSLPADTGKVYPDAGASLTFHLHKTRPGVSLTSFKQTRSASLLGGCPVVSVRFHPHSLSHLLAVPVEALENNVIFLRDDVNPVWTDSAMSLLDVLLGRPFHQQVQLIENWIENMLLPGAASPVRSMRVIKAAQTLESVSAMACRLGTSTRTLERTMLRIAGVSPSTLSGFHRMAGARDRLARGRASLADVAVQAGYFDQAHFTHAFHDFHGETPAQYRKRKLSYFYNSNSS